MARVKKGSKARQRRNKILKLAKGFHFDRSTFRQAKHTVDRALNYAYIGRKLLKRDMRQLWITRIGAAARLLESSYSEFMNNLKKKGCTLNRKMLSDIAARDFEGFKKIFEATK